MCAYYAFYMYAQRNHSAGKICAKLPRYEKCQCEQQFDNSCGSASLADLARVATQKGFGARGMAMNFPTLAKLKIPAIVYIEHEGVEHFSMFRGVKSDKVYLADPSMGNIVLPRQKFEKMWRASN